MPDPQIVVTVPLDTVTGQGSIPAHLHGIGEIPNWLLADLLPRSTIRCVLVDPFGTVTHVGHATHTPSYSPPDRLRRFATIAWVHCAFPGCDVPADHCQLDHMIPHPAGPTCQCNLVPLCQLHHNLKTHGGWTYTLATGDTHPPGTLAWTSPTGRTLHTRQGLPEITSWWPDPPVYPHRDRTPAPKPHPQPQPPPPDPDEPPPF